MTQRWQDGSMKSDESERRLIRPDSAQQRFCSSMMPAAAGEVPLRLRFETYAPGSFRPDLCPLCPETTPSSGASFCWTRRWVVSRTRPISRV